jgi:hypothetical protein
MGATEVRMPYWAAAILEQPSLCQGRYEAAVRRRILALHCQLRG